MRLNELCLYGGRTCPELTTPRRRARGGRHRGPEHAHAEISRERGRPGQRSASRAQLLGRAEGASGHGQIFTVPELAGKLKF